MNQIIKQITDIPTNEKVLCIVTIILFAGLIWFLNDYYTQKNKAKTRKRTTEYTRYHRRYK